MFEELEWLFTTRTSWAVLLPVAIAVVFCFSAYLACRLALSYWRVWCFDGPPCHWFKGHMHQATFDGRGLKFHLDCTKRYKTAYRIWFGPVRSAIVLCHPETVKAVLPNAHKEKSVSRLLFPFLGVGLGLQEGERWKSNRKLLNPAFRMEALKPYTDVFKESARVLLDKWAACTDGEVELFHDISLLTLDSIMKCAFSYSSDCQVKRPDSFMTAINENTKAIMDRFLNPLHHSDFLYKLTSTGRRFMKNARVVSTKADEIIRNRRKALVDQPEKEAERRQKHYDFLDILLDAQRDNGQRLTDEEIRAEVRTFMFAGVDTVMSAICWILYCLALHPEHQTKCREEVDHIFEEGKELEWKDLQTLSYVKLCINEAMRLYSPVPVICRSSDKNYHLQGRHVPEGTFLYVNIFALHRNPHIWENPEVYDPLRFTAERFKPGSPQAQAFIPFSTGPRNCIGQHFAMTEIKTTLAMILHRFELSVSADQVVPMEDLLTVLVLRSKSGIRINIMPRNNELPPLRDENNLTALKRETRMRNRLCKTTPGNTFRKG